MPTIAPKTTRSVVIAPSARPRPLGSRWASTTIVVERIRIAPDISRSIDPALLAFFPAKWDAAVTAEKTRSSLLTVSVARSRSSGSIPAIILNAVVIRISEAAIFRIAEPALLAFSPENLLATIRAPNMVKIPAKVPMLLFAFPTSSLAMSLKQPTRSFSETTIARIVAAAPNLTPLQAVAINARDATTPSRSVRVCPALLISILSRSFRALTRSFSESAKPIMKRELLEKVLSLELSSFDTATSPAARTPRIARLPPTLSPFRLSSVFIAFASRSKLAPTATIEVDSLTSSFGSPILLMAKETARSPAASTPRTTREPLSFS